MEPVEFREIELILSLSEELNFTRTAEKNYISQPALSKIVRRTEKNLGAQIFERTSPLKITPEGEHFLEYFRELKKTMRDLEDYCARLQHQRKNDITIGAPSYFCTYLLPRIAESFKSENEDVSIKLIEANDAELRTLLLRGVLDVGLTVETIVSPELTSFPLMEESLVLAVPFDYDVNEKLREFVLNKDTLHGGVPSQDAPSVSISEFKNENFLFLKECNDSRTRGLKICRDSGFEPHIIMELDQMLTAYRLAEAGLGIAFIRASIPLCAGFSPDLCFYKIDHPDTMRSISAVCSARAMSFPGKRKFINYLKRLYTSKK